MFEGFVYLLLFLSLPVLGYILWARFYFKNSIQVRSPDKVVIISWVLSGKLEVKRKGNHLLPPGVKILKEMDLSRHPVTKTKGEDRELIADKDGVQLRIPYGYDFIFARKFHKTTGALLADPDNFDQIDDKDILSSFVKTDDAPQHIQRVISKVLEQEIGRYSYDDLLAGKEVDVHVLTVSSNNSAITRSIRKVKGKAQFLEEVMKTMEILINQKLNWVGYNVIDFELVGIEPDDQEIQKAIQEEARNKRRAAAIKPLKEAGIEPRVAAARDADYAKALETEASRYATDGKVKMAELGLQAAERLASGLEKSIDAYTKASEKSADKLAKAVEELPEKIIAAWKKET